MELISRTEELLLLSVWRLQEDAYGLSIRKYFSELMGKDMSVGAVYVPLERLKKRGLLESWESEPTDKRGGRKKRFYKLSAEGISALSVVKKQHEKAWRGLSDLIPSHI
ncbi:MAG: PadR family transcriptional regulator [Balneolaceae bacterium]